MFSASLSLAAKDTPRTGKNIRVYLLSREGEEMKKRMAVPKTPVFYTECLRMRVAYTRSPSTVPRVHSVHQEALSGTEYYIGKKEKDLACAEFSNCQKREGHCKKRSPECCREQENHSQKVCNATQSYSVPLGKASMPQSYSMPPESRHYTVI